MDDTKVRITFYDGFLDEEWYCLPELVQKELLTFLGELQARPTDPDVLARCSVDKKQRLTYALPDGFWLYVRIEIERPGSYVDLMKIEGIRIAVLDVCRLQ